MSATFSRNTLFTKVPFSLVGNDEGHPIWKKVVDIIQEKRKKPKLSHYANDTQAK